MLTPRDDSVLSEQFGAFLVRLRQERGQSQRGAAKAMGISQARLASLEQGWHRSTRLPTLPSPDLAVRIAMCYGLPKEQVLLLAGYAPWTLNLDQANRLITLAGEGLNDPA